MWWAAVARCVSVGPRGEGERVAVGNREGWSTLVVQCCRVRRKNGGEEQRIRRRKTRDVVGGSGLWWQGIVCSGGG